MYSLAAPTELVVSGSSTISELEDNIQLSWSSDVVVDYFNVYRLVADGSLSNIASVNVTEYTDTNVSFNVLYSYYVSAVREGDESDLSGPVSMILTDLDAPDSPTISSIVTYENSIEINWTHDDPYLAGVHLFISESGLNAYKRITSSLDTDGVFTYTLLEKGVTYDIKAFAQDSAGNISGFSDVVVHEYFPSFSQFEPMSGQQYKVTRFDCTEDCVEEQSITVNIELGSFFGEENVLKRSEVDASGDSDTMYFSFSDGGVSIYDSDQVEAGNEYPDKISLLSSLDVTGDDGSALYVVGYERVEVNSESYYCVKLISTLSSDTEIVYVTEDFLIVRTIGDDYKREFVEFFD
jgi:hypothetical protein